VLVVLVILVVFEVVDYYSIMEEVKDIVFIGVENSIVA
jgi:hypothetical protein